MQFQSDNQNEYPGFRLRFSTFEKSGMNKEKNNQTMYVDLVSNCKLNFIAICSLVKL